MAHGLLDIGLDTLLPEGWRKFADLHTAAERTRAALGNSEVLDLASHSITSTHQPRVELRLDDVPLATVAFDLSLTFAVKAAVATVRDGRLVSLHSGVCDVEGALGVGDKPLASRIGTVPAAAHGAPRQRAAAARRRREAAPTRSGWLTKALEDQRAHDRHPRAVGEVQVGGTVDDGQLGRLTGSEATVEAERPTEGCRRGVERLRRRHAHLAHRQAMAKGIEDE